MTCGDLWPEQVARNYDLSPDHLLEALGYFYSELQEAKLLDPSLTAPEFLAIFDRGVNA